MSDDPPYGGRPRRTRQSVANALTPKTTTPNPYKKPTYLVGRNAEPAEDSPDDSSEQASEKSVGSRKSTPARRGRRGRGSLGNSNKTEEKVVETPPSTPKSSRGKGRGRGAGRGGNSAGRKSVNSASTNWTSKTRPECVATRNDRRSTGGSKSKKRKRGYNSQDYHYGSDFESDQNDSEPDPAPSDSAESDEENDIPLEETLLESDSDISGESSTRQRLPSPPVPVWMESDKEVEELEIPRSSDDLLLSRELIMEAVSIYEPLRRFATLVRLTPFRFEDFCAALASEEQSPLLVEIHIQLLKSLLREDEISGTVYGPNECKDSVQSIIFFMDNLTWAESLRAFVESDPAWSDILDLLNSVEYPFCQAATRIKILNWLVDAFLLNNNVRDSLTNEGNIVHEDYCRSCNRLGELICCETCPAVYHLGCISGQTSVTPTDDWICPVCSNHELTSGISDCTSELEKAGLLLRHEKLGYDRHGRQYWFLVRRILIESEDRKEVWYYSTRLQVEELLHRLDADSYESFLVENIQHFKDEIYRQMGITEKVTNSMNIQHRKTYLEAENAFLTRIHEERELIKQQEADEKLRLEEDVRQARKKEEDEKLRVEEEERKKKEDEKRRIREERLAKRNQIKAKKRFGDADESLDFLDASLLNDESKDSLYDHEETIEAQPEPMESSAEEKSEDLSEALTQPIENGETKDEPISQDADDIPTQKVLLDEGIEEVEVKTEPEFIPVKSEHELALNGMSKTEKVEGIEPKAEAEVKTEVPKLEAAVTASPSILPKIFAKSKSLNLEVDSEDRMTRLKSTGLYKLGHEGGYRHYVNNFSSDPLALSKVQHGEERDKRRQMSHKFSLTPASDCKWIGVQHGFRTSIVATMRATLIQIENAIPTTLMHCNWLLLRKGWMAAVNACTTSKDFSKALSMLVCCLRPSVFNPIWAESTGHVKLLRTSANERENRKKIEKRDKKDRDDEEDRLRLFPQFVKYSIPAKHQVWKQKGEEFRVHGRWGWIWLSTLRPAKPVDSRKKGLLNGPHKHVIQVKSDNGKVKTMLIDPDVFDKLMAKRTMSMQQKETEQPSPASPTTTSNDVKPEEAETTSSPPTETHLNSTQEKMEVDEKVSDLTKVEDSDLVKLDETKPEADSGEINVTEAISESVSSQDKVEATQEAMDVEVSDSAVEIKADKEETAGVEKDEIAPAEKEETSGTVKEEYAETEKEETAGVQKEETFGAAPESVENSAKAPSEEVNAEEPSEAVVSVDTKPATPQAVGTASDNKSKEHDSEVEVIKEVNLKPKVKVEKSAEPSNPLSAARKFRTELINVSLGIVSANRILYPKIAHQFEVLDTLLARRLQWQNVEEKELVEKYGKDYLDTLKLPPKELQKISVEMDDSFPLAGGYSYSCYSHECLSEAKAKNPNFEARCYSPMCRLKFVMLEARRRKLERERQAELDKTNKVRTELESKRIYTKPQSSAPIYLKQLPDLVKKRESIKHPVTSKFCSVVSRKPSILILPQHELRKLARTGGRSSLPSGYTVNSKPNSWIWPYPCGRPYFKTSWHYRTVHASGLAAAALQLRILYACVRWDDIQMKPPNTDGKSQITTDMEIITSEILNHRVVGRFEEIFQYLRRRHIVPIDAPKTIRGKNRDNSSSEVTPSRSGLRKRKRAESPDKTEPTIREEWVDEEKLEVWEIRYYGDKQEKKIEKKPETPSTRTKSGVSLKHPEKYDPSPKEPVTPKVTAPPPEPKTPEVKEPVETEIKVQRAVHLSKRDNHAKTNNNTQNKVPTPTASQQLKQNAAAAAVNAQAPPTKTFVHLGQTTPVVTKKFFVTKPTATVGARLPTSPATPKAGETNPGILSRKLVTSTTPGMIKSIPGTVQQLQITPASATQQLSNQRLQVFRTADGKLQVKGLLAGQHAYQTADGKVHVIAAPQGTTLPSQSRVLNQLNSVQTITSVSNSGLSNALSAITQAYTNALPQAPTPTVAISQPLVNISNPAIKTVITTSASSPRPPPPLATYTPSPRPRKTPVRVTAPPNPPPAPVPPQMVNIGLSAAQLVASNVPIRIQTQRGVFEISADQIQTNNGQHQIVLGHGLPIINLAPSLTPVTIPTPQRPSTPIFVPRLPNPVTPVSSPNPNPNPPALTTPQSTVTTSPTSPSKLFYSDGLKNYVINTTGLSPTQAQSIVYQMQQKKFVLKNASGLPIVPVPLSQVANLPTQQIQIIQQSGKPMQFVQGPQVKAPPLASSGTPTVQQQPTTVSISQSPTVVVSSQPQYTVVPSGIHQIATIGGQRVVVNHLIRQPDPQTQSPSPATYVRPPLAFGTPVQQPQQLQRLVTGTEMSNTKTIIRVDSPKYTGGSPIQPTATSLPVVQQFPAQSPVPVPAPTHVPPTVTRTPGLPISIVSPSKPKVIIQASQAMSLQRPKTQPPPLTASSAGHLPQTLGIMTSQQLTGLMQQQQQNQIRAASPPQQVQIITSGGQQLQQAQIMTSSGQQQIQILTSSGHQQFQFLSGQQQQVQFLNNQINPTITVEPNKPSMGVMTPGVQQVRLIREVQQQQGSTPISISQQHQPKVFQRTSFPAGSAIPASILPTTLLKQQQQLMASTSPLPSQGQLNSSPISALPKQGKLVGQVIQTPQGPQVIVQGLPQNMTPQQLAQLQVQLSRQLSIGATGGKGVFSSNTGTGPEVVQIKPPMTSQVLGITPTPLTVPSIIRTPGRKTPARKAPTSPTKLGGQIPKAGLSPKPALETHKSIDESIEAVIGQAVAGEPNKIVYPPPAPEPVIENFKLQPLPPPQVQVQVTASSQVAKRPVEDKGGKSAAKKRKVSGIFGPNNEGSLLIGPPSKVFHPPISAPTTAPAVPHSKPQIPIQSTEMPRFVLSQDLVELSPQTPPVRHSSISPVSPGPGPSTSWSNPPISVTDNAIPSSSPFPPLKTSRRKSPVRTDPAVLAFNSTLKVNNSMTNHKSLTILFKQKELLKKDMMKKRLLLEKDCTMEFQEEISEELVKQGSPSRVEVVSDSIPTSSQTQKQKRRKSGESPLTKGKGKTPPVSKTKPKRKSPKKSQKDGEELYCICRTPYDNTKFYVGCDSCSNWFHGECIGITEEMSKCLSDYLCDTCQNPPPQPELKKYCLCKQPYDDTQFYIGCDRCQDWFHGRCVGILPVEADEIEEYTCPNCNSSTPLNIANLQPISISEYPLLAKLFKQIQAHKSSWPFLDPVDAADAPDYYTTIKEPMDLQTVEARMDGKCYTRLREFISDMTKIFDNCRAYNNPGSQFYKSAEILETFFAQKIKLLRQRLVESHSKTPKVH